MALDFDAVLVELLSRLRALRGGAVEVSALDWRGWPSDAVAALKAACLLVPGPPATSIVCSGCEEACVRPVHVVARASGEAAAFVLCHLRDDIDRVPVALDDLARWRLTVQSLADGMAGLLGGGAATTLGSAAGRYRLGFVQGKKQNRAVLHLRVDEVGLRLVLAGHVLDVQDTLVLHDGRLAFDQRLLARCVDAPTNTALAEPKESHEVIGKRMLSRKLELKRAGSKAFLLVIAQEEDCSESWVKQLIAKVSAPNPFTGLGAPLSQVTTVSTRKKRPR